jgi:hypothetical protein
VANNRLLALLIKKDANIFYMLGGGAEIKKNKISLLGELENI